MLSNSRLTVEWSDPLVTRAVKFLDVHPATRISELAQHLGCSTATLERHFVRQVGCPVARHHLKRRLEAARASLLNGQSVKEAMALCGFSSRSAFTRRFVEAYACTPGRYLRVLAGTPAQHCVATGD